MLIEEIIEYNKHWLLVLVVPSSLFLTTFFIYLSLRMLRRKLEPLVESLGGEIVLSFLSGAYLKLFNEGMEMRIGLSSGSRNSPPYLVLKQMTPLGFDLAISKENIATRKLGDWGVLKDIKIGDPLFDEKYLVRSSDPVRAQNFLQDHSRRQGLEDFFNKGFTMARADNKAFTISKANYKKEDLEPESIRADLDQLRRIASI